MTGKVYFISAPGRIKVGFTTQPERRLQSLRSIDMEQLTTIAVVDGSRKSERRIHELLQDYHLRGEWFRDCDEVREIIANAIQNMPDETPGAVSPQAPAWVNPGPVVKEPALLPICLSRIEGITRAMVMGTDREEIRRQNQELIAMTETMLGRSLSERNSA